MREGGLSLIARRRRIVHAGYFVGSVKEPATGRCGPSPRTRGVGSAHDGTAKNVNWTIRIIGPPSKKDIRVAL